MVSKKVEITNKTGLHARPAALFSKLANSCPCDVSLEKEEKKVNAKSILGVLSLAITQGSQVTIITEGEDEQGSLDKLVDFVNGLED